MRHNTTIQTVLKVTFASVAMMLCSAPMMAGEPLRVSSDRFSSGLLRSWVAAYVQSYPTDSIEVVDGKHVAADLRLTLATATDEASTPVARYALLPVTSKSNPSLAAVTGKGLAEKDLRKLFFQIEDDEAEGDATESKRFRGITVYSGLGSNTSTPAFAEHFHETTAALRGRRIAGEDRFLLQAIQKDPQSVTVNYVNYLFDLSSGHVAKGLELIPLKGSRQLSDAFVSKSLEAILDAIETDNHPLVATGYLTLKNETHAEQADSFLQWVASQGQQLNHSQGFLEAGDGKAYRAHLQLAKR